MSMTAIRSVPSATVKIQSKLHILLGVEGGVGAWDGGFYLLH